MVGQITDKSTVKGRQRHPARPGGSSIGPMAAPDTRHRDAVARQQDRPEPLHPLDVQRQADEVPLALDLVQPPHAESAEAERLP